MDKFLKLKEEREKLEQQKKEAETLIQKCEEGIANKNKEMGRCYADFFKCQTHQDFKLYTRFPSKEALQMYFKYNAIFPLNEEGKFHANELAEMIKQFYSYQKQQEYQIFTIGVNEKKFNKDHGFDFYKLVPHLYFLIGNEKILAPFLEYNGQFINKEDFFIWYVEYYREQNIISIPLKNSYDLENPLSIECFTSSKYDKKDKINYYDYICKEYERCIFSKNIDLFANDLSYRVLHTGLYGYNGIRDLFSFNIHKNDTFIAKILLSICIYKYNNGIKELTSEDYHHIFETLYGEEVDIIKEVEKDIPRSLKYVPSNAEINLKR